MHKKLIIIGAIIACLLVPMLQSECFAATHYVVTNGTPGVISADPYANWATAGTNIIDVVNAAMTNTAPRTVCVSNGTYYLTNQVTVTNALALRSVNGRDVTIVDGNNYIGKPVTNRCFELAAICAAVLDGFTVTHGYVIGSGGGVRNVALTTVENCRIVNCTATNGSGGGVNVYGGIMTNCEVIGNVASSDGGGVILKGVGAKVLNCDIASNTLNYTAGAARGGGICASDASLISDCLIYGNTATVWSHGGGVCLQGVDSVLRNSLIYGNHAYYGGVNIYYNNGKIQNCTIANNMGNAAGCSVGGIYAANGSKITNYIENVVSYFNAAGGDGSNIYCVSTGSYQIINSCIAPTNAFPTSGIEGYYYAGNIESNPQFINKDTGNWRLQKDSPCVNFGTNYDWMTNAVDLDGRMRIRYGTVDMGAYETIYEGTIYRFGF